MFSLRMVSRLLLVLEGCLLIIPSIFGIMIFFGCIVSVITGIAYEALLSCLSCVLAFSSFYALWKLYAYVLMEEFDMGYKPNATTYYLASIGFVLTIFSFVLNGLSIRPFGLEIFAFGILYVPTYLHLLFEIKRQIGRASLFKLLTLQG